MPCGNGNLQGESSFWSRHDATGSKSRPCKKRVVHDHITPLPGKDQGHYRCPCQYFRFSIPKLLTTTQRLCTVGFPCSAIQSISHCQNEYRQIFLGRLGLSLRGRRRRLRFRQAQHQRRPSIPSGGAAKKEVHD